MLITDKNEMAKYADGRRLWQGIPGIERSKNGRTFICFYSGKNGETFGNFALVMRSDDGREFGNAPIAVAYAGNRARCFDPVLWIDPLGRLWFIWNVQPQNEVRAVICDNPNTEELVWGEEFLIGYGVMMNKPTVLSTGEWLFPVSFWKPSMHSAYRYRTPDIPPKAYAVKTSDNGESFIRMGGADVKDRSFDEHMILELDNGVLAMYVRTTYGIGVAYSYDRGYTWSHGEDSGFGGPCSRFHIKRLRSGRVLLINHYKFTQRNNLTALLSEDGGKTFPFSLLLDGRNSVSYPDATECDDGYIYITYDRERGGAKTVEDAYRSAREILTAKITEEDIIKGELVSKESYLGNVANKLGELSSDTDLATIFEEDVTDAELASELMRNEPENVLPRLFDKYPLKCEVITENEAMALDSLLMKFTETGYSDVRLLEKIISAIRAPKGTKAVTQTITERVLGFVREHFREDLTVTEIAKAVNVSRYYMAHIFKKTTGVTVTEYRNAQRLTEAKRLLMQTDATVSEIAQACGFSTSAYLTETFTRSELIPPTEYRKLHKN